MRARSIADNDPSPPVDAGVPDAPPDAPPPPDAPSSDAAVPPDAAVDPGPPLDDDPKGCGGCSGGRDPSVLGVLVLLVLGARPGRRARGSRARC
ncbi:MAG TPA: hypothetical protein VNO30_06825 [Kofleriaceae bacterium]|nr:hypothetical protein [Kofleriaceae bacterium]